MLTGQMQASNLTWFDGQHPITYQLPRKVEPVVETALAMWKDDMRQVTGLTPVASRHATIRVVRTKSLPVDGFRLSVKGESIIIEGGNGRGMAYGLLELSRLAGVSPWIWWGDVVPEKKNQLVIDKDYLSQQQPSVAYRGPIACQRRVACHASWNDPLFPDSWCQGGGRLMWHCHRHQSL